MAVTFWKGSTRLASPTCLIRWSLKQTVLIEGWMKPLCRLKCPRITPRQLSNLNGHNPGTVQPKDAFQLAQGSLNTMMRWVVSRVFRILSECVAHYIASQGYSRRIGDWIRAWGQSVGRSSQVATTQLEEANRNPFWSSGITLTAPEKLSDLWSRFAWARQRWRQLVVQQILR